MPRTIGEVVADARSLIQDTVAPYRYSDDDLAMYLSDALVEVRRLRPDFFIGLYDNPVTFYTSTEFAESFHIDEQAYVPVVYFVAGSAELRDDEHTVDNRAGALLRAFSDKLTQAV